MAAAGQHINEVIDCGNKSAGAVSDIIVATLGGTEGYQFVAVTPQQFQAARSYRPGWATAVGAVSILLCGIGILLFFYKKTELCSITIEETHRGTTVRFSGEITATAYTAIVSQLRGTQQPVAAGDPQAAPATPQIDPNYQMSPPNTVGAQATPQTVVHTAPEPGPYNAPVAPTPQVPQVTRPASVPMTPQNPVSPAAAQSGTPPVAFGASQLDSGVVIPNPTPAPGHAASAPAVPAVGVNPFGSPSPPEATIARTGHGSNATNKSSGAGPTTQISLQFDTGSSVIIDRPTLLGRQPEAGPGEESYACISVNDHEMSISKTHLAIELVGGGLVVTDRGSMNGSMHIHAEGQRVPLVANQPVRVSVGDSVQMGNRTFLIVSGPGF